MTKNQPDDDIPGSDLPESEDSHPEAEISKSQRKRDASAITQLAQSISELPEADLNKIPLDSNVREAVNILRKTVSFGARKRQLLYVGKLLRSTDVEPVQNAFDALCRSANKERRQFQIIEEWRDRLLSDDAALAEFLHTHPEADRQRLRQLIRNSARETRLKKPPKSSRELFKQLREIVNNPS